MATFFGYYPSYSLISNITLGSNTVVTFPDPHEFTIGEVVSFRVSPQYGTFQLNNEHVTVMAITTYTITVPINSSTYTPFIPSPSNPQALAMVVPSSSGVVPGAVPPQTNLLDAFDNIPEV